MTFKVGDKIYYCLFQSDWRKGVISEAFEDGTYLVKGWPMLQTEDQLRPRTATKHWWEA